MALKKMPLKKDLTEDVDIYAEIGIHSPYLLAKHQGVKLITSPSDLGEMCGMYQMSGREAYTITLNPAVDIETQETTVYLLIQHHNSEKRGQLRYIMKRELKILNHIAREAKKISNIITDIFLSGSLSKNRA